MKLRINGEKIPENKQGRKVKLWEMLSTKEIDNMLKAGKKAGEEKARSARAEKLKGANKAERP